MPTRVSYEIWAKEPAKKKKRPRPLCLVGSYPERLWEKSVKMAFKLASNGFEEVAIHEVHVAHVMKVKPE